jgi:beta-glucosidase
MFARPFARLTGPITVRRLALIGLIAAATVALIAATQTTPARSADPATTATVAPVDGVILVHPGDKATVELQITTANGQPLDHAVTVSYATGATLTAGSGAAAKTLPSTATPNTDYTPASGTVIFPSSSASGTVETFQVVTAPNSQPSEAKTINTSLTTTDTTTTITNDPPTVVIDAHNLPYLNPSLPINQRVDDLLSRMSLAEKVGQMTEADRFMFTNPDTSSNNTPNDIRAWLVGSLLSGGGDTPTPNTPQGWAEMVDGFQARALATPLQIPLIYGEDTVHGVGNMMGATIFPHNIGIGSARDPDLARQEGQVTAAETRPTGPQWGFAPCICVARDIRWGRTYESFGEDPALVERMETEIGGLQGMNPDAARSADSTLNSDTHILSTAKHYAGDGGTKYGTGDSGYPIDQGVDVTDSKTFNRLFISPYVTAVHEHQVGAVMPSYSSVQLDGASCPTKMSADKDLLTGTLKQQLNFQGFVISDYNAIDQIGDSRSCPIPSPLPSGVPDKYSYQIGVSANAGIDMFMVPSNYQTLETDLNALVTNGYVPVSRVNDAVARILRQKFELGLFEHPFTDRTGIDQIGDAAHRAVAARAAAESQVLLKNAHNVLPLSSQQHVYVAGSNADNLGAQTGGWTLTWQGQNGAINDTGTTILNAIKADDPNVTYSADASAPTAGNDVGVVVVGEHPYAEGQGDVGFTGGSTNGNIADLNLNAADHQAVDTVCHAMPCVVLIVSGRPMTVTSQLPEIDGLVASWLPGSEGEGVADTLFGRRPFTGQLPQSWPRSLNQEPLDAGQPGYDPEFPFGWGLHDSSTRDDVRTAKGELAGGIRGARARLGALLASHHQWNANGSPRNPAKVMRVIRKVAGKLVAGRATFVQEEAVVAIARDVAQAAIVASGGPTATTSPLIASADHALLTGDPDSAVALLSRAAGG